ncbi:MAG: UvrD-helicase domain-containing protein, partial [Zetaproteobacteria bacterium]|nr:UvrD-helicase domain-containing protein [Zetaproteobacteria bacterium]
MNNIQLISASAGSGKTFFLMEEIAKRIQGEGCDVVAPEAIMATTFTNKAAAELKERIRMKLLGKGCAEEAQRIYDGLIGTVNSICAQLLKEYAFEAGLSPAVDILPEEDAKRIFQMATKDAIEKFSPTLELVAKRLGLMGYGSGFSKQDDWRDFVQRIVELARSNGMQLNDLDRSAQNSWQSLNTLLGTAHAESMNGEDERLKEALIKAVALLESGTPCKKPTIPIIRDIHQKMMKGWELSWADWVTIENIAFNQKDDEIRSLWGPWESDDVATKARHLKHPRFRSDMKAMIEGVFACAAEALSEYAGYKKKQGLMDFVDQEVLVLDMTTHNRSFQNSMRERLQLLMVDEFQDTSPIQLALFLKLSELAKDVIWVGDQKQSIYGFRGADPALMDAVATQIESLNPEDAKKNILKHSWRSKELLVDFCNDIFATAFAHQLDRSKVCLSIPEARKESGAGGWLEDWLIDGQNATTRSGSMVAGIKALIQEKDIQPGDIAVLCRSNEECSELSAALNQAGVRASIAQGELLATQECVLAVAALRYMTDSSDSVAMAEIVCYADHHSQHQGWMKQLLESPNATKEAWKLDPIMQSLDEARGRLMFLTPLESLELAMRCVGMDRMAHAWGETDQRLSNLDQLREACVRYQDRCKSRRGAATVSGFLTWLYEVRKELMQAEGHGSDTVNILTYHKSKGLEWPVVIMASLQKPSKSRLFGASVQEAELFQADDPLQGRGIRFWPWPYGTKRSVEAISLCLDDSEIAVKAKKQALSESQRLLYVGMTRARDGLVLARQVKSNKAKQDWLDELVEDATGNMILDYDEHAFLIQQGTQEAKVYDAQTRHLASDDSAQAQAPSKARYMLPNLEISAVYPPATFAPSGVGWGDLHEDDVEAQIKTRLGDRLNLCSNPKMADFGNAMHGFFGADDVSRDQDSRLSMAENLLKNWGVAGAIRAADMLEASDRLTAWIQSHYPDANMMREWPISMKLSNQQETQGWIDTLLELPDGYVIIDHKSYPGTETGAKAKSYAPQLQVYKQAVELATGKPVLEMLIHMPLAGEV